MDKTDKKILEAYDYVVIQEKKATSTSVPDKHQLKILKDTVRNPAKGMFLGGPSAQEAEEILKSKFGYSDKQIKKMSEETIEEAYKVSQNPSDKLWYALGSVGKYWMPVSSGYKSKKQAEDFAKKQPLADKAAKKLIPEDLNEASEVEFKDFDSSKQKFITSLVGKGREKNQTYFSGIHGTIVNLQGQMGAGSFRVNAKDLKKIASNKDVRWVEISSVAMGYNTEKDKD